MSAAYRRASKKQLAYIEDLCTTLGVTNPTLYSRYRLEDAAKLIATLQRKVDRQQSQDRQQKLL